jgi:Uma2 family endonuclease
MATVTKPITAEAFMQMDLGEGIHELVRGEVIDVPQPMPEPGRVAFTTGFVLELYGCQTGYGYVLTNDSAVLTERGPDTVRGADVCYYSHARWPREKIGKGLIPVPPDLVVEVYSPGNRPAAMRAKVNEYLDAGVLMVWVIPPVKRQLVLYRPDDFPETIYNESGTVENLPELPGFRCAVSEFFA